MFNLKAWEIVLIIAGILITVILIQNKPKVLAFINNIINKNNSDRQLTDEEISATYQKELAAVRKHTELAKSGNEEDKINLANSLNSLAVTFSDMEKDNEAISSYRKSLKIWSELVDKDSKYIEEQAKVMNNFAISLSNIGELDEAEKIYSDGVNLIEKLPESDKKAFMAGLSYMNFGSFYTRSAVVNKEKAILYFTKAKDAIEKYPMSKFDKDTIKSINLQLDKLNKSNDQ